MTALRPGLAAVVAVALLGCGASARIERPAIPPPAAERPTLTVGEQWIRSDGVYELTRVRENGYVFTADGGRRETWLSRDLVPLGSWHYGRTEWHFTSPPALAWPLVVGAQGHGDGYWLQERRVERRVHPLAPPGAWPYRIARVSLPATFTWVVEAYETVRVPAGAFSAYRLFFAVRVPGSALPEWWQRAWYAPDARQFVKAEGRGGGPTAFQVVAVDPLLARPLAVALDAPEDQARVARPQLVVGARVTGGRGVTRLTATLDGATVYSRDPAAGPEPEIAVKLALALHAGPNVFLVTAVDATGARRQEARTFVYDPDAARVAAEALRGEMLAARAAAAGAESPRLAEPLWQAATSRERDAEEAGAHQQWESAGAAYRDATAAYARAAREAERVARRARAEAETRQARDAAAEARRAAEVAEAPRLAAILWARGEQLEREAEAAAGRDDGDGALAAFADARATYREAEDEATRQAAAAERARLQARRRQLEVAEDAAAAAAVARRVAEEAGAAQWAPGLHGRAQALEQDGRAALDRQEFTAAGDRLREAARSYQDAARTARAEVERLAALRRQRAEAETARQEALEARRDAEASGAERHAPERFGAAGAREQEARASLAREAYPRATTLFREARAAYRAAAEGARAAVPLEIRLVSPAGRSRVEQESVPLVGVVESGRGVRHVVVTLDGVEVHRAEDPAFPRALALDLPVRLREGPNTLVVTATAADGSIAQEVRSVDFARPVPLAVTVRYPEDRAQLGHEASVVAADVRSSRGVAAVRVTLNGVEIHHRREPRPRSHVVVAVPLELREGANAVVLAATEADGTVREVVRTVTYVRPRGEPAAPVTAASAEPDRWAVVIGAGRYEHPGIPPLRYAVRDAEAVYETLVSVAGFKKEHVLLLTDETEERPTLRNVRRALGTVLARRARKDDLVVIFFAGHGAPEPDLSGTERDGLAKYLVPLDAEPDDLYATALPMDELQTVFGRIEAERVVAFLDTCYSGAAGGRTFSARRTRAGHLDDAFLARLAHGKGRAIVTAARPTEVSVELPELGHGLFTYFLVRGLRGAADLDRDRVVTLQELYRYLEQEVVRRSRAVGANQHPVMKAELDGALPLATVGR